MCLRDNLYNSLNDIPNVYGQPYLLDLSSYETLRKMTYDVVLTFAVLLSCCLLLGYTSFVLWQSNRLLKKRIAFLLSQQKDSAYLP